VPKPLVFRIVLALTWLNLAVLAADAVYNIAKAVINVFVAGAPTFI
jgi:hypothetical protein